MLFNVIGYSNQLIGQVEASDAVEAWGKAGKEFENILDVREVEATSEVPGEGRFTPETTWALEDITIDTRREPGEIRKVTGLTQIEDALREWTMREPGDIRKLTRLTRANPEYLDRLHKILRKQYGDRIIVYRGGGLFYTGGRLMKGAISVTTNKDIAIRFGYGQEPLQFTIDTNKVLAASPTVESELIVYVSDLKPVEG